jgi:hypothetical protein
MLGSKNKEIATLGFLFPCKFEVPQPYIPST